MEAPRAPIHHAEEEEEEEAVALRFQRAFLAGLRLAELPWQDLEQMLKKSRSSSLMLTVLQKTIFHPLCLKYPPSAKYRKCFLSQLIQKHESADVEPLDQLYEALGDVLNAEEATYGYKHYFLPLGAAVTLRESVAIISRGTTGLVSWDAGFYLAEWALENAAVFTNRSVLELGSGAGFTGITICKSCQPKRYTFSDHHESVLQLLRENVHLNGFSLESEDFGLDPEKTKVDPKEGSVGPSIAIIELDWNLFTEEQLGELKAEVIIAADVVYDPELTAPLIHVLRKLSSCRGAAKAPEVYIAFTVRNSDTFHSFQTQLDQVGIGWHTVSSPQTNIFPYNRNANLTILRLIL